MYVDLIHTVVYSPYPARTHRPQPQNTETLKKVEAPEVLFSPSLLYLRHLLLFFGPGSKKVFAPFKRYLPHRERFLRTDRAPDRMRPSPWDLFRKNADQGSHHAYAGRAVCT